MINLVSFGKENINSLKKYVNYFLRTFETISKYVYQPIILYEQLLVKNVLTFSQYRNICLHEISNSDNSNSVNSNS